MTTLTLSSIGITDPTPSGMNVNIKTILRGSIVKDQLNLVLGGQGMVGVTMINLQNFL